ncbi:MAG: FAD-dependent oxidoreductase, partial [Gordonia polyisoprenivorans]|nr:FAD-dependent oxidoreductase [Gordonia polyisoprenivorans]
MSNDVDVVVVGAGLSGLIAARALRRSRAAVLVVEASDRCGGRAYSVTSSLGSRLDLGGQWVGHDHQRLMALADELGATRFTMHTPTMPSIADGSRRIRVTSPSVLAAVFGL